MSEQSGAEAPDDAFRRPDGVESAFAPRADPPPYTPPPATVSPAEREVFGRPGGAGPYQPPPGSRLTAGPMQGPAVPRVTAAAFGRTTEGGTGFDAPQGDRIAPSGPPRESPWWKADAERDPWRDPASPFWLGRGAVFAAGQPAQLDPDRDDETSEDEPLAEQSEAEDGVPRAVGLRGRFGLNALLLSLLVALVAGLIGGGAGYWLAERARDMLHNSDVTLGKAGTPANRPPGSVADIAKRVGPAVVSIAVQTQNSYGVGSGVVVGKDGYVLTNNHVVSGAKLGGTIIVTFSNEDSAKAQIVGLDAVSDLAVLKVPNARLTVAALGDSDNLAVGDPVVAIGSPLGLEGTVTAGIVSALGRAVHVFDSSGTSDAYLNAIQTDAPINPGNSGGALVDAAGTVIGINSAAALSSPGPQGQPDTPASGIGYAIPINYARDIAQQLIRTGKAQHGSLDAQGRTATAGLQEGAYLEQIEPGGAAAKAGLRNGDVIVSADGRTVLSYDQLVVIVQQHRPGDRIGASYYRGATKRTATVTLGSA